VGADTGFESLANFRDLGGHEARDGRTVRRGRLYRSDALSRLRGDGDRTRFAALGVRTVIDLRYPSEVAANGRVPALDGLAYHNLSIEHRPYDQAALGEETEPVRYLADRYAEVAADGVVELRRVVELVADSDNAPLVFHCASGKDRTGVVAALVLGLLGVSDEDIAADFAATGAATDRLVAAWHDEHAGAAALWRWYGHAPAGIMRLFLDELAARYGSVYGYAVDGLGVAPHRVEALRAHLLG
jgi:protein-tyrosine phosphatase